MAFPTNPSDGTLHHDGNVTYRYENFLWQRVGVRKELAIINPFIVNQVSSAFGGNSAWTNIGTWIPPNTDCLAVLKNEWTGGNFDIGAGQVKITVALRNSITGQSAYSDFWRHAVWDGYTINSGAGYSFTHSLRTNNNWANQWQFLVSGNVVQGQSGAWRSQYWRGILHYNAY